MNDANKNKKGASTSDRPWWWDISPAGILVKLETVVAVLV